MWDAWHTLGCREASPSQVPDEEKLMVGRRKKGNSSKMKEFNSFLSFSGQLFFNSEGQNLFHFFCPSNSTSLTIDGSTSTRTLDGDSNKTLLTNEPSRIIRHTVEINWRAILWGSYVEPACAVRFGRRGHRGLPASQHTYFLGSQKTSIFFNSRISLVNRR